MSILSNLPPGTSNYDIEEAAGAFDDEEDLEIDRRDLFAAFALAGMLASGEAIKNGTFAEMAFIYADSMEEARETK